MYKCENCNQNVPLYTKVNRVVIETRLTIYPKRRYTKKRYSPRAEKKILYHIDSGGHGYETAREIVVCDACAIKLSR